MSKSQQIQVLGFDIGITQVNQSDYINMTDMVKKFGDDAMIYGRMRNRNTLEFIGSREELYNPNFKGNEFETFKKEAGTNAFTLSPSRWIENTDAIGLISKSGNGGGTFAHKDVALEISEKITSKIL